MDLRVLQHFFDGGLTVIDVTESVFTQGNHAQLNGFLPENQRGGLGGDEIAQGVSHVQKLVETFSSFVSRAVTNWASTAGEEIFSPQITRREVELVQDREARFIGHAT